MSIESASPTRQDGSKIEQQPAGKAGGGSSNGAGAAERRIFICYPRAALDEVVEFHKVLQKRLDIQSRSYKIFRDLSEDEEERVNKGDNYRTRIAEKLAQSVCCIVILVPSILESEECAIEVREFERAAARINEGFFYPIEFSAVGEEMRKAAQQDNVIAQALLHIDRDSFADYWSETNRKNYEKKVDSIAREIHRRINRLHGGADKEPAPAPQPSPAAWGRRIMVLAACLAVMAGGLLAIPAVRDKVSSLVSGPPAAQAWLPVDTAFDPVVPVPAFTQPKLADSYAAPPLGPGTLAAGIGPVVAIRQARVDGKDWYEFEMNDGSKRYVEKHHLPVTWTSAAGCLYTKKVGVVMSAVVNGIYLEEFTALVTLKPIGNQVQSSRADGELWYRYRRRSDSFGYVRADYADLLPVERCT